MVKGLDRGPRVRRTILPLVHTQACAGVDVVGSCGGCRRTVVDDAGTGRRCEWGVLRGRWHSYQEPPPPPPPPPPEEPPPPLPLLSALALALVTEALRLSPKEAPCEPKVL